MKPDAADGFTFGGIVAISIGAYFVYAPLGLIVPGAFAVVIGVMMGRAK